MKRSFENASTNLSEQIEELQQTGKAAVTAWEQTHLARLRAHEEPDRTFPILDPHELARVRRKEQLERDRLAQEPRHQQKLRKVNELPAEEARRVSAV